MPDTQRMSRSQKSALLPFYPQGRPRGSKETELMKEEMNDRMREAGQKGRGVKGTGKGKKRKQAGFCPPDFQEFQAVKEERGGKRGYHLFSRGRAVSWLTGQVKLIGELLMYHSPIFIE